ncbi:hypothetical protein D3C79_1099690 [compost metagenome]
MLAILLVRHILDIPLCQVGQHLQPGLFRHQAQPVSVLAAHRAEVALIELF